MSLSAVCGTVMKFEFAYPWFLLLVLAVPPLIAWWLYQGRNALRHSATQQAAGPLTLRALDASEPLSVPGESETNISDALAVALQRLENAGPRRKVLILLTDGEHNVNPIGGRRPKPDGKDKTDELPGWTPRQLGQLAV